MITMVIEITPCVTRSWVVSLFGLRTCEIRAYRAHNPEVVGSNPTPAMDRFTSASVSEADCLRSIWPLGLSAIGPL